MPTTWPEQILGSVPIMGSRFPLSSGTVQVHSVFRSALNFTDKRGRLYTLVSKGEQMHPSSALVSFSDPLSGFDGLSKSDQAMLKESGIYFSCGLWVSFLGAKRVHPSQESSPPARAPTNAHLRARLHTLSRLQDEKHTSLVARALFMPSSEPSGLNAHIALQASLLVSSIRTHDIHLATKAIEGLLGLGPGATPTGDDFLCGFLLALHMGGEDHLKAYRGACTTALMKLLHSPNPRTTDISLQLLALACEGLFPQSFLALARTFSGDAVDDTQYISALGVLSSMGHSSGYDAATGLLFGLSALLPDFDYEGEV